MMSLHATVVELDRKYASVQNDEELVNIQAAVEQVVKDLIEKIELKDPRFACKLMKSGSFYDGTKIIQADEFDFLWCIKQLSHLVDDTDGSSNTSDNGRNSCENGAPQLHSSSNDGSASVHTKPYVQVFCKDITKPRVSVRVVNESDREIWKDCMADSKEHADFLDAGKIKRAFFRLVESVLADISFHPYLKLKSSTGITFGRMKSVNFKGAMQFGVPETFEFLWKEERPISVDISVCIQLNHWPGVSDIEANFDLHNPNFSFFEDAKKTGFLVVPKIDILWRLSVAPAEKFLLTYIKKTNPSLVSCYRAMKYLNETHFVNEGQNVKLTDSYVLKTNLFHFWTNQLANSSASTSVVSDLGNVLIEMMTMLHNAMVTENMGQIFITRCNIMKTGPWVQNCASALLKCIHQIKSLEVSENMLKTLLLSKIEIESPPRKKLSDYKITVLK